MKQLVKESPKRLLRIEGEDYVVTIDASGIHMRLAKTRFKLTLPWRSALARAGVLAAEQRHRDMIEQRRSRQILRRSIGR